METEWQHYLRQCIDTIVSIAEGRPFQVFEQVVSLIIYINVILLYRVELVYRLPKMSRGRHLRINNHNFDLKYLCGVEFR